MIDVINLALPFFGVIFLGYACGRFARIPELGLAWMNFFLIYVALPALFFRILAATPLDRLSQVSFIVGVTLTTFVIFALSLAIGFVMRRGTLGEATMAALAGAHGNVGYMGPGLALATLGAEAAAPVALIFCFEIVLMFSLVPFLMALAGTERKDFHETARHVIKQIITHPFIIATALGVLSAAVHFEPPVALDRLMGFLQSAAAPCALFTLGVTVALRPIAKMPWEVPMLTVMKLIVHPVLVLTILTALGPFAETWVYTAVLMAALPPALNVFIIARQYDTWVEQASGAVLLGTLVSVVTLTTVMLMVKNKVIPLMLF